MYVEARCSDCDAVVVKEPLGGSFNGTFLGGFKVWVHLSAKTAWGDERSHVYVGGIRPYGRRLRRGRRPARI